MEIPSSYFGALTLKMVAWEGFIDMLDQRWFNLENVNEINIILQHQLKKCLITLTFVFIISI